MIAGELILIFQREIDAKSKDSFSPVYVVQILENQMKCTDLSAIH